ncbi:hypothetical protein [Sulfuriroseicoccus oceanibius]|uniref:PA14 domain-containing protein n=1 Tax=Sulfuriroseicoccus oceanibius TaxID=2707525 RepID=A0A6B3L7I1_9BACT|nr:hypothetical protein [Sulfuriroseicoccus oceanibius]QQL43690.1 hypothetical protein G3M56_007195 [Sulfuriroseicoccus oceanibius]
MENQDPNVDPNVAAEASVAAPLPEIPRMTAEEAEAKHQQILRRERLSSVMIAVLVHVLIVIGLAVWKLAVDEPAEVKIQARVANQRTTDAPTQQVTSDSMKRKPSPPSQSAKLITANVDSAAVFVPEVQVETELFNMGTGDTIGLGLGTFGVGDGDGGGGGGDFGRASRGASSLEGNLYDFKQDEKGKAVRYDIRNRDHFVKRVKRLHSSRFSESSFGRFFKAPKQLFLTTLAVPFSDASAGPRYFGAADKIKPSGWVAHYSGKIAAPEDGTYRFVGNGDDYLAVFLRKQPRLIASWTDIQGELDRGFRATDPTGKHKGPFNIPLIYGEWFRMRAGEEIPIDICLGERPGGKVGFVLMIEKKGVEYGKGADGRPILPLFTTTDFSAKEKERIKSGFGAFQFDWKNVPVFTATEDDGF